MPNDLNVAPAHRISAAAVWIALVFAAAGLWWWAAGVLAMPICLNRGFYGLLAERRGWLFAVRAVPWQLLYLIYSSATFAVVTVGHYLGFRP